MVRNNFIPKSPEQARLYEELKHFISSTPNSVVVTLKNPYSNKLIRTTIHQLGYNTKTKKFKDSTNPKIIKAFRIYRR